MIAWPWPLLGFFFSFFAQRRPHALHSVFGPVGPFRHSGESSVPVTVSSRSAKGMGSS